jgi:DNA-binding response OmpR family regulator
MSSGPSDASTEGNRLGGARADFVASLGRKINDARELLAVLEDDASSRTARDELRRRLHALGAGARLLRFEAMASSLGQALAVIDRGAQAGTLAEQDVVFVAQVIDDLPALAWGEAPPREAPRESIPGDEGEEAQGALPMSALVVGGEELADVLTEDAALRARAFECERTVDVQIALELARAYAPDVMLVDADVPRAPELIEALLDDPLTEPVPIVVVGSFRSADEAARFVALGVAKALPKPVAPDPLRRVIDEILDAREGRTVRVTLGEPTLEQLAERLGEELKRALVESVDRPARSCRVPLGEGTEVLGALWGAIARVQEIVSQRTGGAIRFGGDAPEGAIALAPWLHQDVAGADRLAGRGRGAAADVRRTGRRVLVADDDPGVTWFIADLLRTAGCEVHEALDGKQALETAHRIQPELVVSDILMPGMDGFALSRALHRDVALRDTPVILLSWKEDLLQRVRELGASAAAYMRKESDSRAILARVREVLRPRARIEMRLRGDGEVRGRLDGLTARLLLELVGAVRKDARVAVRDATCLYEIEIREGTPRRASRTGADGGYASGERALASLLGVASGRFVVSPSHEPVRGELSGTLAELLARPIATARGVLAAATGARTMHVERIVIDDEALEDYLRATPDPARSMIKRVAKGASPRQMLLAGEVSPSLFEDVVCDLAARGAIKAVQGPGGVDLLAPAVDAAITVLRGAPRPLRSVPPNARPSAPAPPMVMRAPAAQTRPAPAMPTGAMPTQPPMPAPPTAPAASQPPSGPVVEEGEPVPSSLEDAVMRELSDRSPDPGGVRTSTSNPPPIIEPSALRKRSSNPPENLEELELVDEPPLPSLPPDAIVPAHSSEEILAGGQTSSGKVLAVPPAPPVPEVVEATPIAPPLELREVTEATAAVVPKDEATAPVVVGELRTEPIVPAVSPPKAPAADPVPRPRLDKTQPMLPTPAAVAPPAPPVPAKTAVPAPVTATAAPATAGEAPRRPIWGFLLAFGALVAVVAAVLNATRAEPPGPAAAESTAASPQPLPSPSVAPSASTTASSSPATSAPATDELPPGAEVPPGFGLIEVKAPAGARVRVDGAIAGSGAAVSAVAAPGFHDLRVEKDGRESKFVIEVRASRTTRIDATLPP